MMRQDRHEIIGRGFRSSEFWVVMAAFAAAILNKRLGLGLSSEEIFAILGIAAGYCGFRTWLKR